MCGPGHLGRLPCERSSRGSLRGETGTGREGHSRRVGRGAWPLGKDPVDVESLSEMKKILRP